jgi:hypothetical protein
MLARGLPVSYCARAFKLSNATVKRIRNTDYSYQAVHARRGAQTGRYLTEQQ